MEGKPENGTAGGAEGPIEAPDEPHRYLLYLVIAVIILGVVVAAVTGAMK